ncbi:MAG: L-glutamate gamma-semialdehyde dehydrogenase [Candidatus Kapaibacteriales bacterium]
MEKFQNCEVLDFSIEENSKKQKKAIAKVKSQLGKEYPNYINGKEVTTERKTKSYSPFDKDQLVGTFQKSGKEDAENAMQAALDAFETWKYTDAETRADFLFKAAAKIRERRFEINAWMINEAGKNFTEADADTAEAIDFLEFYAREGLRYSQNQPLTGQAGEKNEYFYIPLGVGVVIPPWNFPFAILVGMTAAAIVSGNTVVLKPSSDTPMMGWLFYDILRELGLPNGVLNFLVASGAEAGDYLVDHPKTRFISFTGSMEVGNRIYERAAKVNEGQIWLKRVVAEMGGKDAMLIDSEADIELSAKSIVAAAFGFQGQKCSACSRAIIDEKVYDKVLDRVLELTKGITQGDPNEDYHMGAVISESAYNSILEYIEIGKKEGKLLLGGGKAEGNGWFIQPTIIETNDENDTIAQEEIFGPVLAIIKSRDFDHGIEIFNGTRYGLTGVLITNNPDKLERGKRELHCGNLYLNRKCTGALVDVHPFGGFNMSGTDSKAGSRDYLMLFMQGKSVATNANHKI